MFKYRYINLIIALGIMAPSGAQALNLSGTITKLRPDSFSGGGAYVRLEGSAVANATVSCPYTTGSDSWFFLGKENPMYYEVLTAAFVAKAKGMNVIVRGSGSCNSSNGGYEDIRYIELR